VDRVPQLGDLAGDRCLRRRHPGQPADVSTQASPVARRRVGRLGGGGDAGISFFTLVLGELAPKRLALQRSERVSLAAAPLLDRMSTLARPLVWLLSKSTNLVVKAFGGDPGAGRGVMTEQELRDLLAGSQSLSPDERHIVSEVFDAGKRQIREVLVPRTEVEFLPASMSLQDAAEIAVAAPYSRFPVYQESYDDVIGFVHARDLLDPCCGRLAPGRRRPPHGQAPADDQNGALRPVGDAERPCAPGDRDGRVRRHRGIVTLEDLVEELIGDIQDEYDGDGQSKQLIGGDFEVDGLLNLDEFAEQTGIELPEGPYETVAGYVLAMLGHLPGDGEAVEAAGRKLVVTEMDGRRIARVRVGQPPPAAIDADQKPGPAN
jgi:putative hemolysin